ncbi:hypothetical protein [Bradyrhizobium sp. CCBAU 53338]|uniref:hypothetical protein n=1 Tax=Bradyrhizobium sp. CCBAU 53338 TaxID=1325111 RepID=UPI00188CC43A|nr:hypothetical protein [Bradyrhizobium sp. CCBAU 53338]
MLARDFANCRRIVAVVLCALIIGGCAIRPLPDDTAHISTYNIVRQIRCETRQAVIESLRNFLMDPKDRQVIPVPGGRTFQKVDDKSYAYAVTRFDEYDADKASIAKFDPRKLTGFARYVVDVLLATGVAYNFDLTGYEQNNIDPEINFIRPLPVSTQVQLGLKGNFDRYRQNERSFTITDNFYGLIKYVPESYCTNSIVEANIIYPIYGKVGVHKMVYDFMLLSFFGNLTGDGSKDFVSLSASAPPTMVDQLEFQTTIGGSATPKVVFAPIGPAFQVSDATLGVSAMRKDTHKLTMGLYLDQGGAKEVRNVRTALFDGFAGNLITATGGRAELGAARAVEQFLQQKIFKPTIVIQQ